MEGKEDSAMPLIKEAKLPATKAQSRVQTTAWTLIYGGLLTLITGYTMKQMTPLADASQWYTGDSLMLVGSLATAVGAVLIYIRSRMK
jgi:hypothetical protein